MKDRTGECWYSSKLEANEYSMPAVAGDSYFVIISSECKGKYYVHTCLETSPRGIRTTSMREWSKLNLEGSVFKRVG